MQEGIYSYTHINMNRCTYHELVAVVGTILDTCGPGSFVYTYVCVYMCAFYFCMYVYAYIHIHVYTTNPHIHTHARACIFMYMYLIYVYICIYLYSKSIRCVYTTTPSNCKALLAKKGAPNGKAADDNLEGIVCSFVI